MLDPKQSYDALVIFAHSQGTVITADLLRFVHAEAQNPPADPKHRDPLLSLMGSKPVYLMTMGCPLRQLYALRFPYLYGYVRDDTGRGSNGQIKPDETPHGSELNVREWINAYRSGDYVGRYLWGRDDKTREAWVPVGPITGVWNPPEGQPQHTWHDGGPATAATRVEFCIGPGAHTHYWDSTAEPIAETLDALIARA